MSNILEYTLLLKDQMSGKLSSIGISSDAASSKFTSLKDKTNQVSDSMHKLEKAESSAAKVGHSAFSGLSNLLGAIGISAGLYQVGELFTQGIEKAHLLHAAEAQLANTMQNMGVYSQEAFEKAVIGSGMLASHIKFSKGEVIALQSQLRLVGNIGEDEMNRMIAASADMATKFGMQLPEAGNAIAKAINNPEMMKRLAMQLKIDPETVKHIQDLAKHGKEAAARLELISVVEQKVGGAAKAAFDADPTARFDKAMGKIKLTLGEIGIGFQKSVMPVVEWVADKFIVYFGYIRTAISIVSVSFEKLWNIISNNSIVQGAINLFQNWWKLFDEGKWYVIAITAALGAMLAITVVSAAWSGIATAATWLWTTAQAAFNSTMWANPITWIIASIVALIAAIAYVIYKTDGWGKLWEGLITFFTNAWAGFKQYFVVLWLEVQDKFMSGVELIEKGWYRIKSLWDKEGADAGLKKLNDESSKRAQEIAAAKGKMDLYNSAAAGGLINGAGAMHWNSGKSLGDIASNLKNKLGIGDNKIAPAGVPGMESGGKPEGGGLAGSGATEGIATGGTRNTTVNINFKNMVENMVFGGDSKENRGEMEKEISQILMRILGMAKSTA